MLPPFISVNLQVDAGYLISLCHLSGVGASQSLAAAAAAAAAAAQLVNINVVWRGDGDWS